MTWLSVPLNWQMTPKKPLATAGTPFHVPDGLTSIVTDPVAGSPAAHCAYRPGSGWPLKPVPLQKLLSPAIVCQLHMLPLYTPAAHPDAWMLLSAILSWWLVMYATLPCMPKKLDPLHTMEASRSVLTREALYR
jgi:hypothetical protein